jgi:tRNA wybutosine-synthesizing protein 3
MKMFELDKKNILSRADQSKKGAIDPKIQPLVDIINKHPSLYTTSSCSGRVSVLQDTGRKIGSKWLYVAHDLAEPEMVQKALENSPKGQIIFVMESFIIHVCAKTMDDAKKILDTASGCGLKHSGIMSFGRRIMIEIIGNERIEAPIADGGRNYATREHLAYLVKTANEKLLINHENLARLKAAMEKF